MVMVPLNDSAVTWAPPPLSVNSMRRAAAAWPRGVARRTSGRLVSMVPL
jgi:hypothetical protein